MASAAANLWVLVGLSVAGILLVARRFKRVIKADFGAFIERFELLPPPPPAPPKAPHPLAGLSFAVADLWVLHPRGNSSLFCTSVYYFDSFGLFLEFLPPRFIFPWSVWVRTYLNYPLWRESAFSMEVVGSIVLVLLPLVLESRVNGGRGLNIMLGGCLCWGSTMASNKHLCLPQSWKVGRHNELVFATLLLSSN